MTLNGTLIVQAINVAIAYFILRWLYFKPAIVQIQQQQAATTHVKNTIVECSSIIEQKKQQQKEFWIECQQYCQKQMPAIAKSDVTVQLITPAIEHVSYDEHQLKELANVVTNALTQRIDHVF